MATSEIETLNALMQDWPGMKELAFEFCGLNLPIHQLQGGISADSEYLINYQDVSQATAVALVTSPIYQRFAFTCIRPDGRLMIVSGSSLASPSVEVDDVTLTLTPPEVRLVYNVPRNVFKPTPFGIYPEGRPAISISLWAHTSNDRIIGQGTRWTSNSSTHTT